MGRTIAIYGHSTDSVTRAQKARVIKNNNDELGLETTQEIMDIIEESPYIPEVITGAGNGCFSRTINLKDLPDHIDQIEVRTSN